MKTSFYLTAICIISLSIFFVWSKFQINNHDTSISVIENDHTYRFSATYNRSNTRMVWNYINRYTAPNRLGNPEDDYFDAATVLQDNARFHIKKSPGEIKIEFDKLNNSTASYYRIKKMCEGIKGILAGK